MYLFSKIRKGASPGPRLPILIHPEVRVRLRDLLFEPEMQGVGYSAFINRACELAETEIVEDRRKKSIL